MKNLTKIEIFLFFFNRDFSILFKCQNNKKKRVNKSFAVMVHGLASGVESTLTMTESTQYVQYTFTPD